MILRPRCEQTLCAAVPLTSAGSGQIKGVGGWGGIKMTEGRSEREISFRGSLQAAVFQSCQRALFADVLPQSSWAINFIQLAEKGFFSVKTQLEPKTLPNSEERPTDAVHKKESLMLFLGCLDDFHLYFTRFKPTAQLYVK